MWTLKKFQGGTEHTIKVLPSWLPSELRAFSCLRVGRGTTSHRRRARWCHTAAGVCSGQHLPSILFPLELSIRVVVAVELVASHSWLHGWLDRKARIALTQPAGASLE